MSWITKTLTSSIGRKVIMSLSGLFLISFLLVHLTGNFLLLKADEGASFNLYTKFMTTNPVIRVLEIGLLLGFGIHIYTGLLLSRINNHARPVKYHYEKPSVSSNWFSRNMVLSGVIVLLFLFLHLYNFWVRYHFQGQTLNVQQIDGKEYLDMYQAAFETFKMWWYTAIYLLAFLLLSFHLNHGFQSAFQSLGLTHQKYTPAIKGLGTLIAVAIPAGFALIALFMFLKANDFISL
jgi:succinate dehydrogenase / fumarate reductase cytochrome b subunit